MQRMTPKNHRRHSGPKRGGAAPGVVEVEDDAGRTSALYDTRELWCCPQCIVDVEDDAGGQSAP